jgi:chromosome segregation ATPase
VLELESRLSIADERADDAYTEIETLRAQKPVAAAPTRPAEDTQRMRQLEADAVKLARELERSAENARSAQDELAAANTKLREAKAKLDAQSAKLDAQSAKLDAQSAKVTQLEESLRQERAAAKSQSSDSDYEREVAALETQLSERGDAIRKLERDLTTLERLGRELLSDLEERGEGGGDDATALRGQLDALARASAERDADLEAARWTIQALEGQLSGGEPLNLELQEARAELSRQATLIAQLKAHGSA